MTDNGVTWGDDPQFSISKLPPNIFEIYFWGNDIRGTIDFTQQSLNSLGYFEAYQGSSDTNFDYVNFNGLRSIAYVSLPRSTFCDTNIYCNFDCQTSSIRSTTSCTGENGCENTCGTCSNALCTNQPTTTTTTPTGIIPTGTCDMENDVTNEIYQLNLIFSNINQIDENSMPSWWKSSCDICEWNNNKIECDNNKNVIKIDLSDLSLNGELYFDDNNGYANWPETLETLRLNDNQLYGTFDFDLLFKTVDIVHLDLSNNFFDGTIDLSNIPASLVTLDVTGNNFTG